MLPSENDNYFAFAVFAQLFLLFFLRGGGSGSHRVHITVVFRQCSADILLPNKFISPFIAQNLVGVIHQVAVRIRIAVRKVYGVVGVFEFIEEC